MKVFNYTSAWSLLLFVIVCTTILQNAQGANDRTLQWDPVRHSSKYNSRRRLLQDGNVVDDDQKQADIPRMNPNDDSFDTEKVTTRNDNLDTAAANKVENTNNDLENEDESADIEKKAAEEFNIDKIKNEIKQKGELENTNLDVKDVAQRQPDSKEGNPLLDDVTDEEWSKGSPITKDDLRYIHENMKKADDLNKNEDFDDTSLDSKENDLDKDRRNVPPPDAMVAGQLGHKNDERKPPSIQKDDQDLALPKTNVGTQQTSVEIEKLKKENAAFELRIAELIRSLQKAKRKNSEYEIKMSEINKASRKRIDEFSLKLDESKKAFRSQLESASEEHKEEVDELKSVVEQQKKAFDELLEEKQILSRVLSDEQTTLTEMQEKIQHPDLGLWLRQRAQRAAILVETPETDAMKFYAAKYMAPKVQKLQHKLHTLEKRVEKTVDHLLPAKYGGFVAFLLSIALIGFPTVVTLSALLALTKSVSLRQYVLLGNIFLAAFSGGLCVAGMILRQDPLQTLYEASEGLFITLQMATVSVYPVLLVILLLAIWKCRSGLEFCVFGCEFVFYVLVAANYHARVWKPAMLGQNIETNSMMYIVYFMDFVAMTVLTISSSQTPSNRMVPLIDEERGEVQKSSSVRMGVPLSTTISRSGRASSFGKELMRAVGGQANGSGKDE